ncbi:Alpha/Beta hydrolase protein [Mycena olivaceomarginata]|nr:Alpha/Beta hydrolase protein [Mycena olivaceomarginata]
MISFLLPFYIFLCADFIAGSTSSTVSLPYATFRGSTTGNVTQFLGMPFARASRSPSGSAGHTERHELWAKMSPAEIERSTGSSVCGPGVSLRVRRFIYGGGFEVGNPRDNDMKPLLERSIEPGEPILIVTPNYCVSALGYLAGKEVAAAGMSNLALRDLIFALEWVQRHISAFGGDPNRVVIGGVSAGSISSALSWLNNPQRSNKLFHGVFLQSGPAIPFPPLSAGQAGYDGLAAATKCSTSGDTLECLRRVPLDTLMAAVNTTADFESFRSLNLIRARMGMSGSYAKIPMLVAICDDEGTTDDEFVDYVHSKYLPSISDTEMAEFTRLYRRSLNTNLNPDSQQGSPFNTGTDNQPSLEYKRLAAFQGDYIMSAPRSFFAGAHRVDAECLGLVAQGRKSASDGPIWFSTSTTNGTVGIDVLLNFINTLDPNRPANESTGDTSVPWQTWTTPSSSGDSSLLMFTDTGIDVTANEFRKEVIEFLNGLRLEDATE